MIRKNITNISIISFCILVVIFLLVLGIKKGFFVSNKISKISKISARSKSVKIDNNLAKIKNFKIINPKPRISKYAFECDNIDVKFHIIDEDEDDVFYDKITIKKAKLYINCYTKMCDDNNWTSIIKKINDIEKDETFLSESKVKTVIINDLEVEIRDFKNVKNLQEKSNKIKTLSFENITFYNLVSYKGFPTEQLITALFRSIDLDEYLKGSNRRKKFF
jgi:hypothetical protein